MKKRKFYYWKTDLVIDRTCEVRHTVGSTFLFLKKHLQIDLLAQKRLICDCVKTASKGEQNVFSVLNTLHTGSVDHSALLLFPPVVSRVGATEEIWFCWAPKPPTEICCQWVITNNHEWLSSQLQGRDVGLSSAAWCCLTVLCMTYISLIQIFLTQKYKQSTKN